MGEKGWLDWLRRGQRPEPAQMPAELAEFARTENLAMRLGQAGSPDFWRRLCPDLTISDEPFAKAPSPPFVAAAEASLLVEQVVEEGYFQTAPVLPPEMMARLAAAVLTVVAAGFLPVFAAVYDEVWQFLPALRSTLNPILGEGFQVIPDIWLWHVNADPERSGWAPHRDFQYPNTLRPDGRPTIMTVWIPFTDATPLNSCIYVLPLSRDPNYPANIEKFQGVDRVQDIRALPAAAGSILGWNQYVLHWGGRSSRRAGQPRISLGINFQSSDVPPFDPLAREMRGRMTFEQRLSSIGTALSPYDRLFPLPPALKAFVAWTRRA